MSFLTLDGVSKRFDGIVAVDSVSCKVDRGQVVGFLGPNGAGKSTTMRMITQYYEPDAGTIRLDGALLGEAGREAKRRIGYLAENNPLYGEMLVSEYLDFVGRLRDLGAGERRRAVDEAVAATGVEPVFHRPIGELSKGFRQRTGLAAAILHRPDLLVLDEPTEGLDPNQRVEIRRLIVELGRERTVLLSTHVLPEIQHVCSRLLIINRGRLVADGEVDHLVAQARGGVHLTVEAAGNGIAERLGQLPGVRDLATREAGEGRVRATFTVPGGSEIRPRIFELAKAHGWVLYELHQEAGSLEDLFHELTAGEAA
jgi:gliding motility-associated transport system ATP-binding protein